MYKHDPYEIHLLRHQLVCVAYLTIISPAPGIDRDSISHRHKVTRVNERHRGEGTILISWL